MEVSPDDPTSSWFRMQLKATCNIEKSYFNDWFTGHLNFQIEHQYVKKNSFFLEYLNRRGGGECSTERKTKDPSGFLVDDLIHYEISRFYSLLPEDFHSKKTKCHSCNNKMSHSRLSSSSCFIIEPNPIK